MRSRRLAILFLLVCPALAFGWPLVGDMTDLGTLPGGGGWTPASRATDINDQGDIVGYSSSTDANLDHAVLWTRAGGIQDLGTPTGTPNTQSSAAAINNARQVVVNYFDGASHAYLYQGGNWSALPVPHPWCESVAYGISEDGRVVGKSCGPTGRWQACVWMPDGNIQFLGTLGGSESVAYAINANGWVVGDSRTPEDYIHAFLWKPGGTMQDLGTLGVSGDNYSYARAINDDGAIVGDVPNWRGSHAVRWSPQGTIRPLATLPDGWISSATDINNAGQVTGWSNAKWDGPSGYEVVHAVVWSGGAVQDLGTLTDNPLSGSWGDAINGSGQVVGSGESLAGGTQHAFAWQLGTAEIVDLAEFSVSGVRRVAVLRRNPTGNPVNLFDLRNSATNKRIKTFTASTADLVPKALAVVPDLNGNGSQDLAVLGQDAGASKVKVTIRDGADGALIRTIDFNPAYTPKGLTVMKNGTGSALGVAGVRQTDGAARIEVRDAQTGTLLRTMALPK